MIALTLINNNAVDFTVEICGIKVQLQPRSSDTRMVTVPSEKYMPIQMSSRQWSTSWLVSTGTNLAHEHEFDYPVSNMVNIYQHMEADSAGMLAAMTLNFGPAFSSQDWMGLLDLSTDPKLGDLTIPGTHNTGTWDATRDSKCQSLNIRQQLEYGIRFFDLRLAVSGDDLRIWHGSERQNVYLARDLLPVIKDFLAKHPTEFVILCVANVSWSINYNQFNSLLGKLLGQGVATNKLYDGAAMPKVAGMGGVVALMRQDKEATFGIMAHDWPDDAKGLVWNPSGQFWYSVQNVYKFGSDYLTAKWGIIKAQLDCAAKKSDGPAWYANFTSASRAPITDPIDIALATDQKGMNYELHAYLCKQVGPQYFGTLPMDFPETPSGLIKLLISMNKLKPV